MSSHSSSVKSPWVDLQVVDMEPSAFPISRAYGIWQPDGWQLCHSSGYIFTTASQVAKSSSWAKDFDMLQFQASVQRKRLATDKRHPPAGERGCHQLERVTERG